MSARCRPRSSRRPGRPPSPGRPASSGRGRQRSGRARSARDGDGCAASRRASPLHARRRARSEHALLAALRHARLLRRAGGSLVQGGRRSSRSSMNASSVDADADVGVRLRLPVRFQRSTTVRPRVSSDRTRSRRGSARSRRARAGRRGRRRRRRGSASRRSRRCPRGSGGRSRTARRPSARPARRRKPLCVLVHQQRLVGDVEADHRQLESAREHRAAASGSAQMLNSAAGVTFPSPIAPPISTIRSGLRPGAGEEQRDVGQRADRDERRAGDMLGEEVDRMLLDRFALRRRQVGAVETGLAVDVGGDERLANERPGRRPPQPGCRRGRRSRGRGSRSQSSSRASGCRRRW